MRHTMQSALFCLLGLFGACVSNAHAGGALVRTSTAESFLAALRAAAAGDTVELSDGRYDLGGEVTVNTVGTPDARVVVRAARTGRAELIGASRFRMDGARFVTLRGFVFSGTQGPAVLLDGCAGVRVSRCTFELRETGKSSWVLIKGHSSSNRIDRCLFQHKHHLGNFITIEGTKTPEVQVSRHDTIDNNHFRDIGPRAENVLEAIRIGASDYTLSSGYTVVQENLFERCDGDPEYVSIKSCDNIIRANTFRECLGTLSLRHGNRNRVEGNFILGNNRSGMYTDTTGMTWSLGTGGIRFCGDSMVIVNNYMEGLTGTTWDAPMAIPNGDADYGEGKSLTKHYRIRDAVIAFNTLVNNTSGIEIGYDGGGFQNNWWFYPPRGLMIANNIIVGSRDTLIRIFTQPEESRWSGNIVHATGRAVPWAASVEGVEIKDARLERRDGWYRPALGSPALGASVELPVPVACDIEGQPRPARSDIGADHRSTAAVRYRILTAKDVGPFSGE